MSKSKRSERERSVSSVVKAVVVAVQPPETEDAEVARSLAELRQLLAGLGIEVEHEIVQRRAVRSAATYLGPGKLREVAAITGGPGEVPRGPDARLADAELREDLVVVADDELGANQIRNLEAALGARVIDRTAVILRVFESRARTREAKLEVELARLEYELPRIRDDHSLGDREGGGGRASRGHTNVELAKQRIRERIAMVRRELEALEAAAARRRLARSDTFRVALVGYTNAGKSSLMRALTGADVLVEDKLFATLGTTTRRLAPPVTPPVLVADTVGFLHRLPHSLMASFRSTLAEANEAWLLLLVVDASDPAFREQLRVTRQVLEEIGAAAPAWVVMNKIDRLDPTRREALAAELPDAIQTSALDPDAVRDLRDRIAAFFARHLVEERLTIPYARQGVLAELRGQLEVVHEEYGETISVTVRGTRDVVGKLVARLSSA